MIRAACMCFSTNLAIQGNSLCLLYTGQLAELPTILDNFYWYSQYHQYSYRAGGWRWMESYEVVGKGYVFTKNRQMTSIDAILTSTCHTKQLNPWPNSSASHVVNHSWLSACQWKMEPFEGHSSTHGCQTGLRKRPE